MFRRYVGFKTEIHFSLSSAIFSTKKDLLINKTNAFVKLMSVLVDPHITTFIMGDLNLPKINWSASSSANDGIHDVIFYFLCSYGFTQFVTDPTRFKNEPTSDSTVPEGNILDIILSTDHLSIDIDFYFFYFQHSLQAQ